MAVEVRGHGEHPREQQDELCEGNAVFVMIRATKRGLNAYKCLPT